MKFTAEKRIDVQLALVIREKMFLIFARLFEDSI